MSSSPEQLDVKATFQNVHDGGVKLESINVTNASARSIDPNSMKLRRQKTMTTPSHYITRSLTLPVDADGYILHDPLEVLESEELAAKTGKRHPKPVVDPSLLFGMERTLFSAWNVGLIMQVFGAGIWMANQTDPDVPFLGGFLMLLGLLFIPGSYALHLWRIQRLKQGRGSPAFSSEVWTGILCFLLTAALVMEMTYAVVYPYLLRTTPVTIDDVASNSTAM